MSACIVQPPLELPAAHRTPASKCTAATHRQTRPVMVHLNSFSAESTGLSMLRWYGRVAKQVTSRSGCSIHTACLMLASDRVCAL
jgi:hypothetical protein